MYIIYSGSVSFIQMRLFMDMYTQEVFFFQIRSNIFRNGCKKLFSLQNVMKINCLKCITHKKKFCKSQKW